MSAALNELTLVALVASIMSSLFQMSAPSNEQTAAGKQLQMEGLGPCSTIYQSTSAETST